MSELNLDQTFTHLIQMINSEYFRKGDSKVWKLMHILAENNYQPAFSLFESGLEDEDWIWRLQCLENLGFHYKFLPDSQIAKKIQGLLITDPQEDVRMASASVLGGRSEWPDNFLVTALRNDPSDFVKEAAYEALLRLANVPFKSISRDISMIKKGLKKPSLQSLKETILDENIAVDFSGLEIN